jgi:hypothetical protein
MTRYRKRPVVIDAMQWAPSDPLAAGRMTVWLSAGRATFRLQGMGDLARLLIATLEGEMTASPGDWVIRGVQGEHYPCKPDIFAATYEAVTE